MGCLVLSWLLWCSNFSLHGSLWLWNWLSWSLESHNSGLWLLLDRLRFLLFLYILHSLNFLQLLHFHSLASWLQLLRSSFFGCSDLFGRNSLHSLLLSSGLLWSRFCARFGQRYLLSLLLRNRFWNLGQFLGGLSYLWFRHSSLRLLLDSLLWCSSWCWLCLILVLKFLKFFWAHVLELLLGHQFCFLFFSELRLFFLGCWSSCLFLNQSIFYLLLLSLCLFNLLLKSNLVVWRRLSRRFLSSHRFFGGHFSLGGRSRIVWVNILSSF